MDRDKLRAHIRARFLVLVSAFLRDHPDADIMFMGVRDLREGVQSTEIIGKAGPQSLVSMAHTALDYAGKALRAGNAAPCEDCERLLELIDAARATLDKAVQNAREVPADGIGEPMGSA